MTPENIYDELSLHIEQERWDAVKQGVKSPEIRVVMTYKAKCLFLKHDSFQRTYNCVTHRNVFGCDMEFRGAFVTIIPGDDIFFHTRCTNLPPQ